MGRPKGPILILLGTVVAGTVVGVMAIGLTLSARNSANEFEGDRWLRAETSHSDVRERMIPDLMANYSLNQRSKAEILALLGPPSAESDDETILEWVLGPVGGLSFQYSFLGISFQGDTVADMGVTRR